MSDTIESLLAEGRTFPPPADFVAQRARRATARSTTRPSADPEAFWARQAGELLDWSSRGTRCSSGTSRSRSGSSAASSTSSYNCLDRHVEAGHGDQVAYHWEGEPGDARTITYAELLDDVSRLANALKALGVAARATGSTSTSGWCPSCPIALLACARIGAAHSVVFGGFSSDSLRDRINDAEAKVLITGDGAWRRGQRRAAQGDRRRRGRRVPDRSRRCLVLRRTGTRRRR